MITDSLKNIDKYTSIPEFIRNYIKKMPADISLGRHTIINDDYMNVEVYETKCSGAFESHKKYIDIQIILAGTERINYIDTAELSVNIPYNEEKDIIFYKKFDGNCSNVILQKGHFAVFYPYEAHMPQLSGTGFPSKVKKAVVKIESC